MTLEIDSLRKRFRDVVALDGVSFTVQPGAVFGFLGANGAGKTTTMRIVLDILAADSGTVTWRGRRNTELPRRTWGYLPEERGLYGRMTVLDQLLFFAGLYGVERATAEREIRGWLERLRIPEYADRRAEELSKGNQQKVQFIASIVHDPEVLVMDEPFSGLDPVNAALLKEAFVEMRDRGKTLVFSTHQMDTVEELCDSIAIVDRGRVVVGGKLADVRRASGRRRVRLAIAGDGGMGWLSALPVRIVRPGQDFTELDIDRERDPEVVLRTALARGSRVTRYEIADPSLEEIFIEHVGRPVGEERHLAKPGATAPEGAADGAVDAAAGEATPGTAPSHEGAR
jgi:ABC-2 type transport system ATP-binding protein